ncbi:hypothetical protein PoB_004640100 [Plakobranchus ocellatus]|uniref:Uncharacterized protein n=1 Tax=Plakobranchus ocellatus TaxID=259542 RepID=A0AAV4BHH6_9GAST|nr:hypothetical protein PoB_004640100 [Plakobranchus ocellatus]
MDSTLSPLNLGIERCSSKFRMRQPNLNTNQLHRVRERRWHSEFFIFGGVGGTKANESALRSVGTLLSWFQALPLAPCLTEGLKA